jgi:cobalt-zinc-cadmium efflux system outer membrane protein
VIRRDDRTTKNPIAHRILAFLACAGLSLSTSASAVAQAPLTEARVTERIASRAADALRAEVRAARARAVADAGVPHPNPSLEWEHQEAFDPNAQSQDLLWLRVPIDLSGRRAAQRRLRRLDALDAEIDAAVARRDALATGLRLFYGALGAERRAVLLAEAQAELDDGARIAASREEAGHGSGYVTARLRLEASLGRSRLAEAELERDALRGRLLRLLELPADTPLQGSLEPAAAEPANGELPEITAAREAESEAAAAGRAAGRAWIPRLTASGAYNRQVGPQVGQGYSVNLEVEVPVFDRGQGARAEAAAAEEAVGRYRGALENVRAAEVRAAATRLRGLRAERERLAGSLDSLDALVRATESGYREGERTLVEVLDARRTVLAARERLLSLDLAIRLADVELRRATGALR